MNDIFRQINYILRPYQNLIVLISIILIGAALRIYNLGTESFWFDELFTVYLVPQDLQTLFHLPPELQGHFTRDAVYYILSHFWVQIFRITENSIRMLSVVFGLLSIGMMYLVGRELVGVKVGLISTFLMAISEFQIRHSQEARFYSLFVLLTLLSLYFYLLALKNKRLWLWIFNALINILLFYTHTYAIFIFAVEYIHYLIYWKHNKDNFVRWGISLVLLVFAIIIGSIPLVASEEQSTASLGVGLMWITRPTIKDLLRIIYGYLFPQNYQHSWLFIGASFAGGLAFFVIGIFYFGFRDLKNDRLTKLKDWLQSIRILPRASSEFVLIACWFICPVLLPFIYSCLFSPVLVDRYTICAAPAFYLLVAIAISKISRIVPVCIPLVALMIVVLPGLQDYYRSPVNEQWREAAIYVKENVRGNDVIVFVPDEDGFQQKAFDWYYQGALPGCGISQSIKDAPALELTLSNCVSVYDRFWVIIRGSPDVVSRMKSFFLDTGHKSFHLINEKQFVGISVYLFELTR